MSIRIHQLSKKIGMDNKDLLALLRERGYSVTSASSTVDNISAESLVQEFGEKGDVAVEAPAADGDDAAIEGEAPAEESEPSMPTGAFVKSVDQIETERKEREAAKAAARAPAPVAPPPSPVAPPAPPRPAPVAPPPRSGPALAIPPRPGPAQAPRPPAARVAPTPAPTPAPAPAPSPVVSVVQPPPAPVVRAAPSAPPAAPPVARPPAPAPGAPPPPPRHVSAPPTASAPITELAKPAGVGAGETNVIQIKPPIVVRDFATLLGMKPFKLISELMEMGIFAALNQSIDEAVASRIAVKHGFLLDIKHRGDQQPAKPVEKKQEPAVDESKFLEPRPPVVCIMGHVDHGKTSLLDKIRSTNVVAGEAGGITQHIGAYTVSLEGREITFLDTPGHAAFNQMRERGANATDIAILVVAADDGFMPQTDEALKFIRAAGVTPIVAINKIDTKGADIDRVKRQMQERDLMPEDWGGATITAPVSATKGDGIQHLLEMILLQADVLELKANPKAPARGVVIEASIEIGRGPTATVLVKQGTLKTGDSLICGQFYAKVRAMYDHLGKPVKAATPSTAVRVAGWSGTLECGAIVEAAKNDREAKRIAEETEFEMKKKAAALASPSAKPASIEVLFEAIAATRAKSLQVVVKADVYGSSEAVVASLYGIKSSKITLEVVSYDVGPISKNDVLMASAAGAAIIGFNVKLESGVEALAKHHGVKIMPFSIIYELVDTVRDTMADLLEPELKEIKLGAAEVRAVFPIAKGFAAGCLVTEGRVQVLANARLRRAGKVEAEGRIVSLRRVKDEVKEVRAGTECGIHLEGYEGYRPGDLIECFEVQKIRPSL